MRASKYPGRVSTCAGRRAARARRTRSTTGSIIRKEGWYEAVLVIDADVIFVRSRADGAAPGRSDVGAVTGYIKEGSRPSNYMNRFISFEYIGAQAGARRAQNVLGAQACLAGGSQLLRRESLEAIGGEIDTSSLAEDTFTTFNVQLAGTVVFEPHAIVGEPKDIAGLWKQRLRWAAATSRSRCATGTPGSTAARPAAQLRADLVLGLLMPALMVLSSASVTLSARPRVSPTPSARCGRSTSSPTRS